MPIFSARLSGLVLFTAAMVLLFTSCGPRSAPHEERQINEKPAGTADTRVTFDFTMVEKGFSWLDLIRSGADEEAVKSFFMKEVATTGGCRAIIHHWERFMEWNNETFYSFILEALGHVPSDKPLKDEEGRLTAFGKRSMLWRFALDHPERLKNDLNALRSADFSAAAAKARNFLPAGADVSADFYIVLFGASNAFSVGEENGFDLFQLPRTGKDLVDIPSVIDVFAHELHHSGFFSLNERIMSDVKDSGRIYLLGLLAAEGMPTHFIDRGRLEEEAAAAGPESISAEAREWKRYSADISGLYRQAETDLTANLDGDLEKAAILEKWMAGAKGPAYVLGADMIAVIERELGRERAVSVAEDYRHLLKIYNSAAEKGNAVGGRYFVFDKDLARRLSSIR